LDRDLAERYRRASADEASRPATAVRNAVLARARVVARENCGSGSAQASPADARRAANDASWRMKAAAGIAVVCIASLVAVHLKDSPMRQTEPPSLPRTSVEPTERVGPAEAEVPAPSPPPASVAPSSAPAQQSIEMVPRSVGSGPRQAASTEAPPAANAPSRMGPSDGGRLPPAPEAAAANKAVRAPPAAQAATSASADVGAPTEMVRSAPRAKVSQERSRAPADFQNSPLVDAAATGDLARVDRLLQAGASPEQVDALGRTPLLVATLSGRTDIVRRLLDAGANVNAAAKNGDTPLAAAQRQGSAEILRLLQGATDAN
jgi:hypothetical protein